MKKLIIASTSTLHGERYLEYLLPELTGFLNGASNLVFVPYARPGGISHESYTGIVSEAFNEIGINVRGLHEFDEPEVALREAEAIFTGGGNTFLLVSQLYRYKLMNVLADVVRGGTPYLGTSAGSNITGLTMQTTNDMPIIYPPSFQTLGLIPFNLNPHYLDPAPNGTHMGETREMRIKEFHSFNNVPVLGLREGSWLEVIGDAVMLRGGINARLFEREREAVEISSDSDVSWIGK